MYDKKENEFFWEKVGPNVDMTGCFALSSVQRSSMGTEKTKSCINVWSKWFLQKRSNKSNTWSQLKKKIYPFGQRVWAIFGKMSTLYWERQKGLERRTECSWKKYKRRRKWRIKRKAIQNFFLEKIILLFIIHLCMILFFCPHGASLHRRNLSEIFEDCSI